VQVAKRLGVAGLDDPADVDTDAICVEGELVGESNVDVPVGGLGQLSQFCGLGGVELPYSIRPWQVWAIIEL
jgi:hypothetical protein